MTWLAVLEWAKIYWRYLAVGLACFLLGLWIKPDSKAETVQIAATQAQSGEIASSAHVTIKPKEPIPSAKGCPPCPQLPDVTIDCGGKASGSQSQALSATAGTLSNHTSVALSMGILSTISPMPVMGAGALASYGKFSALGVYGFDGVWTVGGFVRVFEF